MQQDTPLLYSEDIPCELDHAQEETNQKPPQTTLARDGQTDNLIPICPRTTSHPPKLGYGGCNNNAHTHTHSLLLAYDIFEMFSFLKWRAYWNQPHDQRPPPELQQNVVFTREVVSAVGVLFTQK